MSTTKTGITDLAARFTALFSTAATDGITLQDEGELHASFLAAAMAGDAEKCRVMADDLDARLGAARAARRIEEQRKLPEYEIGLLREEFERSLQTASPSFQRVIPSFREDFAEAEAAQDVMRCRALAAVARDAWKFRTPTEIEEQNRADQEAHAAKVARVQQDADAAKRRQEVLARYAGGGPAVAEADKLGRLWLDDDGAVRYSGKPLPKDVVFALQQWPENVRVALRQRWQDRVIVPAPAKAEAAA